MSSDSIPDVCLRLLWFLEANGFKGDNRATADQLREVELDNNDALTVLEARGHVTRRPERVRISGVWTSLPGGGVSLTITGLGFLAELRLRGEGPTEEVPTVQPRPPKRKSERDAKLREKRLSLFREAMATTEKQRDEVFRQVLFKPPHRAGLDGASGKNDLCRFLKDGMVWRISFGGESAIIPDSVGLQRIKTLIEKQGHEVPVRDLVEGEFLFGADRASDDRTLQEIEERKEQLQAIVGSDSDPQQVAEASEELEGIKAYLSGSTGLAGQVRRIGDEKTAAASRVGKSIERMLVRFESEGLSALARHLRKAILRPAGVSPTYRPSRRVDWFL